VKFERPLRRTCRCRVVDGRLWLPCPSGQEKLFESAATWELVVFAGSNIAPDPVY
jgi:hypothetical protein